MSLRTLRFCIFSLAGTLAAWAQTALPLIAIQGGEHFPLTALPQQIQLNLKPGESRSFVLEEQLQSGLFWTARPQNPAQQTVISHQLQEMTGGAVAASGTATATVTGNLFGTTVVDFALLPPGAQQATATPSAVVRCYVNVQQQPVVVAPAPPVVIQPVVPVHPVPPPKPTLPLRPVELQHEQFYTLEALPRQLLATVRRDGGEIEFYLECDVREGFEWRVLSDDRVSVMLDNDVEREVRLHGHRHRRRIRCTAVRIVGFNRGEVRLVLEYYRQRRGRAERPVKTVDCMVKVR